MHKKTVTITATAFLASLAYACVRYHVFKKVEVAHFPLYVMNKAVAVTALILLAAAVAMRDDARRTIGRVGFALVTLHVVLSLAIITPAYFPALFTQPAGASSMLTAQGEIVLALGAFATLLWNSPGWSGAGSADPQIWAQPRFVLVRAGAVAVVGLHAGVLGWSSWWTPATWPGYLPPLTLLSSLVALAAILLTLRARAGRG